MSELKEITGDAALSGRATVGKDASVGGTLTVKHDLVVEGYLEAPNIRGAGKGLYLTEDALRAKYPRPQDGWWALVGDTVPAIVYVVEKGEWKSTDKTGGPTLDSGQLQQAIDKSERAVTTAATARQATDELRLTLTNTDTRLTAQAERMRSELDDVDSDLRSKIEAVKSNVFAMTTNMSTLTQRISLLAENEFTGALDSVADFTAFLAGYDDSDTLKEVVTAIEQIANDASQKATLASNSINAAVVTASEAKSKADGFDARIAELEARPLPRTAFCELASEAEWQARKDAGSLDPDTLYFIAES